jgi:hypothetical protein
VDGKVPFGSGDRDDSRNEENLDDKSKGEQCAEVRKGVETFAG